MSIGANSSILKQSSGFSLAMPKEVEVCSQHWVRYTEEGFCIPTVLLPPQASSLLAKKKWEFPPALLGDLIKDL